jgi:hypothetical protein
VPDACLATPANILYTIRVTATGNFQSFEMARVANICGATWALDAYAPPAQTTNVQPIQVAYGTLAAPNPCATPSFYIRNHAGGELYMCVAGVPVLVTGTGGTVTAGAMQAAVADLTGCATAGNAWNPATNTCLPATATASVENVFPGTATVNYHHNLNTTNPLMTCYVKSGAPIGSLVPVDANNIAVTSTGAADIACAFSYVPSANLAPDFTFTATPNPLTLVPTLGTSRPTFTVTQSAISGFTGTTTYSMTSSPSGITGTYSPSTITGSGTSTLTASIPYNQASGANTLTLSGTSGALTHTQPDIVSIATTNNGLLYGWPLSEGSGATFNEVVSANNATAAGVTWGTVAGLPGSVPTFSGASSGAIALNNTNANFTGTTPFSVSLWINAVTTGGQFALIGDLNLTGTGNGWCIHQQGTGLIIAISNNLSTSAVILAHGSGISPGVHHVVVTFNGNGHLSGFVDYIDGAPVANMTIMDNLSGSAVTSNHIAIGETPEGAANFTGAVAFPRIYNRVLSSGEVSTLFNAGAR